MKFTLTITSGGETYCSTEIEGSFQQGSPESIAALDIFKTLVANYGTGGRKVDIKITVTGGEHRSRSS